MGKKNIISTEERSLRRENSLKNLMSAEELNSRLSPEEKREIGHKAGLKSAEVRRNNRKMLEQARKLLDMPIDENQKNIRATLAKFGITEEGMNYANAILAVMIAKGVSGDVGAAKYIKETAGYDLASILKEEQMEYVKENGNTLNVNIDGELETTSRVQIYLPEIDKEEE